MVYIAPNKGLFYGLPPMVCLGEVPGLGHNAKPNHGLTHSSVEATGLEEEQSSKDPP